MRHVNRGMATQQPAPSLNQATMVVSTSVLAETSPVHLDVPKGGKVVMVKPRQEYANPCVRSVPIEGTARGVSADMSTRDKVATMQP